MSIHLDLENLYYQDKLDREKNRIGDITDRELNRRDFLRIKRVKELISEIDNFEIWNCHYIALILIHSEDMSDVKLSHKYAKKAIILGSKVTKWLYAASLDRLMILQGKLQKYGTQFNPKTGIILPYDKNTTDVEREEYGVPKLEDLKYRYD